MARYIATVESPRPPADVFDYIADLSTNAEWDPGTIRAEQIGDQPIGLGTEYLLEVSFLGRRSDITYRIVEYDRPKRVTFRGENAGVVSLDRITVGPWKQGSRLTYDATLTPKGVRKVAYPLLALAFRRVGDDALRGLRTALQ